MISRLLFGERWKLSALMALAAAILAIQAMSVWKEMAREAAPASDWFDVKSIFVNDVLLGQEPLVAYDREIRKPFHASWTVTVEAITDKSQYPVCTGSGVNDYDPDRRLPSEGVALSWFAGVAWAPEPGRGGCYLPAGTYRVVATWNIEPPGFPEKQLVAKSNIFNVRDPAAIVEKYQEQQLLKGLEAQ